jgi:chromosome segregation ATPase
MNYKSSPTTKAAVERALKMMAEGKSDKRPTIEDRNALMASRKKQADEETKKDSPNLSNYEKQHAEMKSRYESLGGNKHQYADREQNLSEQERKARGIEYGMNQLSNKISAIKKAGFKRGGKIKHPNW